MKKVSDLIRKIIGMYDKRKSELDIISNIGITEDISVEIIINEEENKSEKGSFSEPTEKSL